MDCVSLPDGVDLCLRYHSGFNTGLHIGEAVNFALPTWIPYGFLSLQRYRATCSMSCLDMERMICQATPSCLGGEERWGKLFPTIPCARYCVEHGICRLSCICTSGVVFSLSLLLQFALAARGQISSWVQQRYTRHFCQGALSPDGVAGTQCPACRFRHSHKEGIQISSAMTWIC